MNNKDIGNIGEVSVLKAFVELGIPVYMPYGDNTQADLVADFNGKLNRIQIKTSIKANDGTYKFNLKKSYAHTKKGGTEGYTKEEVDYFALYNLTRRKILLIPYEELNKEQQKTIIIRYQQQLCTGGNYKSYYEDDFLIEKILNIDITSIMSINNTEEIIFKCPNCGEIMDSFNKTINEESNHCIDCGKIILKHSKRCPSCQANSQITKVPISREELKQKIRTQSFIKIGKEFNLTDNAIRKWCKKYNLPSRVKDIKKYSNKEWEKI